MIVHNKTDLVGHADSTRPAGHCVSGLHQQGIEELLHAIAARLVPHPPEPGAAMPFTPDQVDALMEASRALAAGDAAGARHLLDSLAPALPPVS
jgi:tRNA modification GTPase